MQKFFTTIFLVTVFSFSACNNSTEKKVQKFIPEDKKEPYFPVTDFLLGQLNEIDSLPLTPLKITMTGNKQDSSWLKKNAIRSFAKPFLSPVIDSNFIVKYFTGKSFLDQTINAITFSYDPKSILPDSVKLIHWDLYIDPQNSTVQRIYLVKNEKQNGNDVTYQLTWKVNYWCSIRTIIQQPGAEPIIKEEMMKWNFDN